MEESSEIRQLIEEAERGSVHAQSRLGDCYATGEGVPQDHERAVEWYRRAAEEGYSLAQSDLADCYAKGQGVPQDHEQAVEWYRRSAEGNYVVAQTRLADCYAQGQGVSQDLEQAVEWYRRAAEADFTLAQTELADCYSEGRGVPQDHVQAAEWYRKAAEQGYSIAQTELGACYAEGKGVPQDHEQAVGWYQRAADNGYSAALDRLKKYQQESGEGSNHPTETSAAMKAGEPQRVIRVFVSSTFRDMLAERDELVKRVFLQLRKLCEERGVVWGEVDLRWGITEEQADEGQVLPICLDEIQRCRPYFIGLLGERYGWIPGEISQELVNREPWLQEHRERSVTELEILHGVLNDPEMANHAFFYFRDPNYIDSLPTNEQKYHRERPWKDDIAHLGSEEAQKRCEERKRKLATLKGRIRQSGFPFHENYADPQDLGRRVLEDLTVIIDQLFPKESIPDPLAREAAEHDAFAASRRGVYIGREEYFERLDEHAQGDGPPLVVLGDSGSGKSTLLANWVDRYRQEHPEENLLLHFVGSSAQSADWMAMLRRILGELSRRVGLELEIPDQPDALRQAFANALHMTAAKGRVVLVLDALNQLEDRDQAPDLVWLPPEIPADIRLILSTLPGRPLDDLTRREWPTMRVEPLTPEERQRFIVEYLAQYTKSLADEHAEQIAGATQAANPLYLRVLLEELRLYGDYDTLGEKITEYLSAETVVALYRNVLGRYEQDYERDRPGLVREMMSLLWAARRGLSEAELLEMLGTEGDPLPHAYWSPLYLAAEQALVNRSGLIGFGHDYLRQAVEAEFLPTKEDRQTRHLHLANYFRDRDFGPRKVDELPWQLSRAGEVGRLYRVLADLSFLAAAWKANPVEVRRYWSELEPGHSMVEAYSTVLRNPSRHYDGEYMQCVLELLGNAHPSAAQDVQEQLTEEALKKGDRLPLAINLFNEGLLLKRRKDLAGALRLFGEAEQMFRELGDERGVWDSLSSRADVLTSMDEVEKALVLHKELERLLLQAGRRVRPDKAAQLRLDLARCMIGQARVHHALGDHERVIEICGKQESALDRHRDEDQLIQLIRCYELMGSSLSKLGRHEPAMRSLDKAERLCRQLGRNVPLVSVLESQAAALFSAHSGKKLGAAKLKNAALICSTLGEEYVWKSRHLQSRVRALERPGLNGLLACLILVVLPVTMVWMALQNPWLWIISGPLVAFLLTALVVQMALRFAVGRRIYEQFLAYLHRTKRLGSHLKR